MSFGHVAQSIGGALPGGQSLADYVPATVLTGTPVFVNDGSSAAYRQFTLPVPSGIQVDDVLLAIWGFAATALNIQLPSGWVKPDANPSNNLGTNIDFGLMPVTDPAMASPSFGVATSSNVAVGVLLALRRTRFEGFPQARDVGSAAALATMRAAWNDRKSDGITIHTQRNPTSGATASIAGGTKIVEFTNTSIDFGISILREVPLGLPTFSFSPARTGTGVNQLIRLMGY